MTTIAEDINYINKYANYWRNLGVNVIPADTVNKRTLEKWSEWQDKPIPQQLHDHWKNNGDFLKGIAIIPGKVWHREDRKDYYLVFVDLDNQKAIDEVCTALGATDLQDLSAHIIVEQHLDDISKAHLYFYSTHLFKNKSSDMAKLFDNIKSNEIPAIEVKGLGKHGLAYVTPSPHKNGSHYQIIGTKEPKTCGKEVEEKLEQIYKKYGLITSSTSDNKVPKEQLFDSEYKVHEGHNRHGFLLRQMCILLKRNPFLPEEDIKAFAYARNQKQCLPPLDDKDFEHQWSCAKKWIADQNEKNNNNVYDAYDVYDTSIKEIISVTHALRLHSGVVKAQGMIFSVWPLCKMIKGVNVYCFDCGYRFKKDYEKPEFNKDKKLETSQCTNCQQNNLSMQYDYVNAVVIELRDTNTFSDLEVLKAILFDEDTKSILVGERITITGRIHIMNLTKGKFYPYLYAHRVELHSQEDVILSQKDIEAIERFTHQNNADIITKLKKMFAPSVIGHDYVKEGLLLCAASAGNDLEHIDKYKQRERIHSLLVGEPGNAKSTLLKETIKLVQNSRCETAQHSSGKSLVAIVSKEEGESHVLRLGPVPLSKEAICGINEIGRMNYEDQTQLLDAMEEGKSTINKHGINAQILSPTVIIASANPINNYWKYEDKIDMDEIPVDKAIIDRFDLMFIFRKPKDKKTIREFAERKANLSTKKIPDYYVYLKKHLMYAKRFNPTFTEEAKAMIIDSYTQIDGTQMGSPRVLETLFRLAKARAKLKLKSKVDVEDVKESLEFYNILLQQHSQVVPIPANPRDITYNECLSILQNTETPMLFEDVIKGACLKNEHVKSYIGEKMKLYNNIKLRPILDMLLNHSCIIQTNQKPVILQWQSSSSPSSSSDAPTSTTATSTTSDNRKEDSSSKINQLYDAYDVYDNEKNNFQKNKVENSSIQVISDNTSSTIKNENNFQNLFSEASYTSYTSYRNPSVFGSGSKIVNTIINNHSGEPFKCNNTTTTKSNRNTTVSYNSYPSTSEIISFFNSDYTKSVDINSSPVRTLIRMRKDENDNEIYYCPVDNYPSYDWTKIEEHMRYSPDSEHRDRLYSISKKTTTAYYNQKPRSFKNE